MIKLLKGLLVCAFGLWVALSIACLFLISLGLDEAWTMIGVRAFLTSTPVLDYHTTPVYTSGGLYTIIHVALEAAQITKVWLQRLPSLLALAAVLGIVWWRVARHSGSAMAGLLAICPLIGVTDTAVIGTTAVGTSLALLIFVFAVLRSTRTESPPWYDVVVCGLLFGLAIATRLDLLPSLPAIWLMGFVRTEPSLGFRRSFPARETVLALLAAAIVAANIGVLEAFRTPDDVETVAESLEFYGIGGSQLPDLLDYPRVLNRLLLVQSDMSLAWMAVATVVPFAINRLSTDGGHGDCAALKLRTSGLFVLAGWALCSAWVARAHPSHMRYLWPALQCFSIVLGVGLAWLYAKAARSGNEWVVAACLFLGLTWVSGQIGLTFRAIVMGNQDYLARERSGEMRLDYFRRFRYQQDQIAAAHYVATSVPPDEMVVSLDRPYALCYLAERPVVSILDCVGRARHPRPVHLFMSPLAGVSFYVTPEAYVWIERHARLEAQFGRYSIYVLPDGLPEDPLLLAIRRTNYLGHPLSERWFNWNN